MTRTHGKKRGARAYHSAVGQAHARKPDLARTTPPRLHAARAGMPPEAEVAITFLTALKKTAEDQAAGLRMSMEQVTDDLMNSFTPLLRGGIDQLTAELAATTLIGLLRVAQPDPELLGIALGALIDQAGRLRTRQALAFLRSLAAVMPTAFAEQITAAADRLAGCGVSDPPWAVGLGRPVPGPCFGYEGELDGCSALGVTFSYGQRRHGLFIHVGDELGLRNCLVIDSARVLRTTFRRIAGPLDFREYSGAQARSIIENAMAMSLCPVTPDEAMNLDTYLELVSSRTALLPAS